jgi:peroxiredoxin
MPDLEIARISDFQRRNSSDSVAAVFSMKFARFAGMLSVVGLAWSCTSGSEPESPFRFTDAWSGNVSAMVGSPGAERKSLSDSYAPDFRWHRADGSLDSLSGHKGKIVILNFWATWCGYCVREMPAMNDIATTLKDTVDVIGVSTDNTGDVFPTVKSYINEHPYTYQFVIDSNYKLYNRYMLYSTTGIPQTFIIDQDGLARYNLPGEQVEATLLKYIRGLE